MNDHDADLLRAKADLLAASGPDLAVVLARHQQNDDGQCCHCLERLYKTPTLQSGMKAQDWPCEAIRLASALSAQAAALAREQAAHQQAREHLAGADLKIEQLKRLYEQCAAQRKDWHATARQAQADLTAVRDQVAEVTAKWLEIANTYQSERDQALAEADAQRRRAERLTVERNANYSALLEYGTHRPACPMPRHACDCGLAAALAPAATEGGG